MCSLRLDAVGSAPQSAFLSRRWNQGERASLLEILDAALEVVGLDPQHSSNTTPIRKPRPVPSKGRE
jgi:hypothetical protein